MSRLSSKKLVLLFAVLLLAGLMVAGLGGCAEEPDPEPVEPAPDPDPAEPDPDPVEPDEPVEIMDEVVFATGPVGGSWYPVGAAAGDLWADELGILTHVELGGGEANIRGVEAGSYDFGLSHSFAAVNAIQGVGPFEGDDFNNIAGVATLYPNVQQTVVWADSDNYSIDDLAGKVIAPGPSGFGGETLAQWILDLHDMSYDDMGGVEHVGYSDAVALMKDRHVDVFWPNTLVPAPSITEMAVLGPGVRVIALDDSTIEALEARNPGLMRHTIPKESYRGMEEDIDTITTFTIIICRLDMDEETVYQLTKSMVDNYQRFWDVAAGLEVFNPDDAPHGVGVDLHPGAERYYREIGVLD